MSWWDDVKTGLKWTFPLPYLATEYAYDKAKGALVKDTSGEEEAQKLAALYDNLQYQDPRSDPKYAEALKLLDTYAHGTLTAEDRAREYEALGEAQNFSAGQEGAIAQDAAARGGGGAGVNSIRQQVATQGAAKRLGSADVATSGMAAQRALLAQQEFSRQMQMNTQMQNQFAEWKAGGQAAGIKNLQDLREREAAAQNANRDAIVNAVASFALGAPVAVPATPATATAKQTGYTSSGNIGIPLPGPTSLPSSGSTSLTAPVDFGSGATTADAAARAYAATLPFAGMAQPGGAPSTSSDDNGKRKPYKPPGIY